jgi:ABC-2 type transport system permease protein
MLFTIAQVVLFVALIAGLVAYLANQTVRAIYKRNVLSYFSGVLGYLFIVVFVVAGAFMAFNSMFFTNNQANLDQLTDKFPMLLLFLIPAITMSAWSDERKLGTDELLFTLPATDLQVLVAKYLAVLTVYTAALLFSLSYWVVLEVIGDPDPWQMLATYFGYWLAGAALLGAGMFASVLTSSATVAFVLGAAFCAIPVFIGNFAPASDFVRALSLPEQLRDFGLGIVPFNGLWYFVGLAIFTLYLNLVFISKRHWAASQKKNMAAHFVVRSLCVAAVLIGLNVLASISTRRPDFTSEGLYSMSDTTEELIEKVAPERPITIQAFLSPDVPREYVATRKRLVGLLRQYDQLGGSNIDVRIVDVKPFSKEADEAKLFGIKPVPVQSEREGRRYEEDLYMGAVITGVNDEVIVPFFGAGSLAEYELTRSIRTVLREKRPTLGVLNTDAQIIGPSNSWRIVTELKQQYNVQEVSPDSPIDQTKYDVLLAALPSSLTAPQMKNLVDYVNSGRPTLIFDDPFPVIFMSAFGVSNAPRQPKPRPGGMFNSMGGPPPEPKADDGRAIPLLRALNIAWDNGEVVWDKFNPHPEFGEIPPEYLFLMPRSEAPNAFSQKSKITDGLQEMLAAYSGRIRPRPSDDVNFEALLRTGPESGVLKWEEFTQDGFDPTRMQPTARPKDPAEIEYFPDRDAAHVLAAHITSKEKGNLDVIYVADIDLISDWFFQQREQVDVQRERQQTNLQLDNVTFVLNAVDILAGDDSFLALRGRRPRSRTLTLVENKTAALVKEGLKADEEAANEAKTELKAAQERFDAELKKIDEDTSLDERTKDILKQNLQEAITRQLAVAKANIDAAAKDKKDANKANTEREIRNIESQIRYLAVGMSPIPAILLGVFFFLWRLSNERRDITPDRRVRPV